MEIVQADLYLPRSAEIKRVIEENSQIKTFILSFCDSTFNKSFSYELGQFMMVSVPHCGEAPISFSSSPVQRGSLELSVRKAGKLTGAMHAMQEGDVVGLRGPYGRSFDLDYFAGKDLLFVAGGIGLAPLRSVINTCISAERAAASITILYGSRVPSDIAFGADLKKWQDTENVSCLLTVDQEEPGWDGHTGLVTTLLDQCSADPAKTVALLCGPPLMISAVIADLSQRGFQDENIITTMERHMKCGVGVCRHCHMAGKLVCKDGPVFNLAELKDLGEF